MAPAKLAFFIAVIILDLTGFASTVRVTIEPHAFNEMTDKEVNITCTGIGPAYWAKTVVVIQIKKQDQVQPIVSINNGQGITMGPMSQNSMTAEGHIDKDASKSFLTLTIQYPDIEDTGSYMCQMLFIDERFQIIKENATANVTFYDQSIKDVVTNLMEEVSGLKQDVQEQRDVISQQNDTILGQERQLLVFKNHHSKQEHQFDTLKDFIKKQINETSLRQTKQINVLKETNSKQNEIIQRQEQKLGDLQGLINKQNQMLARQGKQVEELKDDSSKKDQQLNILIGLIGKQNDTIVHQKQQVDDLKDDSSKKEELLNILMDLMRKQNDTNVNQKQQVDKLKVVSSKNVQQLNLLMGDNSRQQQQLDILEALISRQNETIESHGVQLRWHLMTEQVCQTIEGKYYEEDQSCLKAAGSNDSAEHLTWSDSRQACQDLGGDLAQISDKEKTTFVLNMVGIKYQGAWIGVKRNGHTFEYVDGSPLAEGYNPWGQGEPNNYFGVENCGMVFSQDPHAGNWNDKHCSTKLPYVCSILPHGVWVV